MRMDGAGPRAGRAIMLGAGVCLWLIVATTAVAEVVHNLYSATVPVSTQSQTALERASRDALGQVLVKVSGSGDVLDNPVVRDALAGARQHIQQYAFVREEGIEAGLSARFEFDSAYVTRLVTQARLPLWTANRPRVLVWAAVERAGQRQLISLDGTPDLAAQLLQEFDRRGIPAQLPLYDLADATAITVDDIWDLNSLVALAASQRYAVDDVLLGRVVALSTGEWTGDWSYLSGRDRLDRSVTAPTSVGFNRRGVALVAEEMASRYAVVSSGGGDALLSMTVTGVTDYRDYAAIIAWLEGLELIDHANVQRISGDSLQIALVSLADAQQLAALIELNEGLTPLSTVSGYLEYEWRN